MDRKVILIMFSLVNFLFSQAFKNPPESSSALSQSGAFIAQSDDASAVEFNPAGLIQLKKGEVLFGFTYIYSTTKYFYSGGIEEKKYNPAFLPYFYYVPETENENFKFGIGLNTPYGQATEWSKEITREWNYNVSYYSGMQTINFSPALSFRLSPDFSFGIAPNFYYSRLNIYNLIPIGPGMETIGKMKVDGYSFGGTLGFLYKRDNYSIGINYKTPFEIDYDGKFKLYNIGDFDAETKIKFPERYGIGIAFYKDKKTKIEFDIEHYKFSSLKSIPVNTGFMPPYEIIKNWKDIYNFYFGTEYKKSENLKIRGGIAKLNSPIPEETWDPGLPDSDTLILTFGMEMKTKSGNIEFTLLSSNPENIKKEGDYAGKYKSKGFFISVGFKKEI